MTALLVAVGAGLGGGLRFAIAHYLDDADRLHWGTLGANVAGSLLLGALAALSLSTQQWAGLGVGLCGGLTTYSSFAVQTATQRWPVALAYAGLTVGLSLGACALGYLALS